MANDDSKTTTNTICKHSLYNLMLTEASLSNLCNSRELVQCWYLQKRKSKLRDFALMHYATDRS